ncbi:hypothetical protein ACJZ2D_012233 [Fusarium nematophilum]
MWKSKLFQNRNVRWATKQAAATSASAPTSQTDSSANSQAMSVAAAELMDGLEFVFHHLDGEGATAPSGKTEQEPGDLLQLHLERLSKEISKYDNSSVDHDMVEPWACSAEVSRLLAAACQCACSVYEPGAQPSPELIPVLSKAPSIAGTSKASSIWKNDATKTLFVSVRGTASLADHMVNLNNESQDAAAINLGRGATPVFAHRGFLACTNVLLPCFTREIIQQVELDGSLAHVVFTGHSAGGAVAALAFLHFACQTQEKLSSANLSLVTFGSPPVTSIDVTELVKQQSRVKHVLAFVNEFDLVPRLDRAYMLSMIDLYRSSYGLPPDSSENRDQPRLVTPGDKRWKIPPPDHHIVGEIIMLRSRLDYVAESWVSGSESDGLIARSQQLDVVGVSHRVFEQLLFCDLSPHKRRLYLERLEKLSWGCYREGDGVGEVNVSVDQRWIMSQLQF